MDFRGPGHARLVGDYILGPRIGSGSFAVVWKSRHRQLGLEVAVKEIEKKLLSSKVRENLLKEISILSTISHPNIIRLFEAIETEDRIYLVLEYCDGGDLAAYIYRHGRVSEDVARHFMRQLAAGLQVLHEKHLIHRDLKPQNLLLSTKEAAPLLKIGDFGFARSLTPENLAETLCGSPLYMAPEIIKNQKYDAKADLWSVGAILFQLVTGRPPFDGNNQDQLFKNVLTSTEVPFPEDSHEKLNPDCVDLCQKLLRQNPANAGKFSLTRYVNSRTSVKLELQFAVERLTFKEFFDHKFLRELRQKVDVESTTLIPLPKLMIEPSDLSATDKGPQLPFRNLKNLSSKSMKSDSALASDDVPSNRGCGHSSSTKLAGRAMPSSDKKTQHVFGQSSTDQSRVADSMESIEKEYVLVNPHLASVENFSYCLEASVQDNSTSRLSSSPAKLSDLVPSVARHMSEPPGSSTGNIKNSTTLSEVEGLSILHPSTRLQLLHQYVIALAELAEEKYNAGLLLESFSVELLVLATWKHALQICGSWLAFSNDHELLGIHSDKEPKETQISAGFASNSDCNVDFSKPSSVSEWAEKGFVIAFDRTEKLSSHLKDIDATAEMPDPIEVTYKKAIAIGTSGAVDEYMEDKHKAAESYSKAMLLLSFIVREAPNLPLNPPFLLTDTDKKRIQSYITNFQSHKSRLLSSAPFPKQSTSLLLR